jgi:hypothetical protein
MGQARHPQGNEMGLTVCHVASLFLCILFLCRLLYHGIDESWLCGCVQHLNLAYCGCTCVFFMFSSGVMVAILSAVIWWLAWFCWEPLNFLMIHAIRLCFLFVSWHICWTWQILCCFALLPMQCSSCRIELVWHHNWSVVLAWGHVQNLLWIYSFFHLIFRADYQVILLFKDNLE